jgi:PPOX class probable F420-dependent enzyme
MPINPAVRRDLSRARIGHFATTDGSQPSVVPVCFVVLGETVYQAIDAKPKRAAPARLRRVRNVQAHPAAALLVDHYQEDWSRLWWLLMRGEARVVDNVTEQRRAVAALRRKYVQYRTRTPLGPDALVIALDIRSLSRWTSRPPGRQPAGRPARRR